MVSFTNWRVKQRGSRFALESHPEVWEGREGRGYFWLSYTQVACVCLRYIGDFQARLNWGRNHIVWFWRGKSCNRKACCSIISHFLPLHLQYKGQRKNDGARRFTCPRFLQITLSSNFSFHNISFAKKLENEIQVKCLLIQLAIRGFPFALTTPHSRGSQSREIVA